MINQMGNFTGEIKRKTVIGMLRNFSRPNNLVLAAAFSAKMIDCEFFFFTPKDINFTHKKIEGLFYEGGQWIKRITDFPDVVDNSPSRKSNREIYRELEKYVPFTMRRIGNKHVITQRIMDDRVYSDLVIPSYVADSVEELLTIFEDYEKMIIKPVGGSQGKGIQFIEKENGMYIVNEDHQTFEIAESQIVSYLERFSDRKHIIQPYIQSRTDEGLPYDIRIHVRRGGNGQWTLVKIYPRIGRGDGITSNLSQGGSIAQLKPFLKRQFPQKSLEIEAELNQLAVNFPPYFQLAYEERLDALGLDLGIDEDGKIWLFEVNAYPGSTMFELESQKVAMEYAKYLAEASRKESVVQEGQVEKKVIGMFSPVRGLSNLKSDCVAAAAFFECEFFYFTPADINYKEKKIIGRTYQNGAWRDKTYNYATAVDAIYDRVRLIGRKKYAKEYKELAHIPFTHTGFGASLNKLLVYDKLSKEGSLKKYLIPYERYQNADAAARFLEEHKEVIIKPDIGFGGESLYYIRNQGDKVKIIRKEIELNLTLIEFKQWIKETIGTKPYVIQKYINTRTLDEQPFDIRVHMMRNYKNTWDFVAVYPRVGIGFEKITPTTEGGYIGRWQGFVERNFGKEKYKAINQQMRTVSRQMIQVFEQEFGQEISEIGIDFAISKEGDLYLLELNLLRPGIAYYEFKVAKRAIGYAKYLAEQNSR